VADEEMQAQSRRSSKLARHGRALSAWIRASDSYALLLGLLLVDYFLLAGVETTRVMALIRIPLIAGTMLLALHTSHAPRRVVRLGEVAAAIIVAGSVFYAVTGDRGALGIVNLLVGVLLISAPFFILIRILRHQRVGTETILGALCVYVLIGLTFASLFIAIDVLGSINFANPPEANSAPDLLYLSFITLTTVGFGDIVAAHDFGRALLVLEAVIGQIFLITLVARLVAMFGEELKKDIDKG
jgi:hypothetical protein